MSTKQSLDTFSPPPSATSGKGQLKDDRLTKGHPELNPDASKRLEKEKKKIDALCVEFGLPFPQEVYILPRVFDSPNGNVLRFEVTMPKGLGKWVTDAEFDFTIAKINHYFSKADHVSGMMVCCCICRFLTCNVTRLCKKSKMERTIKKVKTFINKQNEEVYHPKGLHIVDPRFVGLRHIEIKSISYRPIKFILDHEMDHGGKHSLSDGHR